MHLQSLGFTGFSGFGCTGKFEADVCFMVGPVWVPSLFQGIVGFPKPQWKA